MKEEEEAGAVDRSATSALSLLLAAGLALACSSAGFCCCCWSVLLFSDELLRRGWDDDDEETCFDLRFLTVRFFLMLDVSSSSWVKVESDDGMSGSPTSTWLSDEEDTTDFDEGNDSSSCSACGTTSCKKGSRCTPSVKSDEAGYCCCWTFA